MAGTYLSGKTKYRRMAEINVAKYGVPPTWEMIKSLLDKTGMKWSALEKFLDIPFNTLAQVRSGGKNLPASSWGFIYEQTIPKYGVKYKLVEIDKIQEIELSKKVLKEPEEKVLAIEGTAHERLKKVT